MTTKEYAQCALNAEKPNTRIGDGFMMVKARDMVPLSISAQSAKKSFIGTRSVRNEANSQRNRQKHVTMAGK